MASGAVMSQTSENKDGGNKRTPCPLHGCKRVYLDVNALELHVKEHEIPAQSLPGKVLLCSTVGCSGSFSNMQKLMEHMRHHHKPNMFFMCESCRTKLRSYRGLLTHLHTCSKVLRGKSKSMETAPPQHAPVTNTNMAAVSMDQKPPGQDSESIPQQLPPQIPTQSFPAAVPQPESSAVPFLGPPYLSHSESFPYPELTQPLPQPPPLSMDNLSAAPEPSDALSKNQTQSGSLESHPAPVLASHSPSLSSAVWRKKNQGMACNRRILWEHSKGLYTCVQCGRTTTNRKEMTQHINTQHSGSNAVDDSVISATNAYLLTVPKATGH